MSEIEKLLNRDNLAERLAEILDDRPEHIIIAWYDEKSSKTKMAWFGSLPAIVGLAHLLKEEINKPDL